MQESQKVPTRLVLRVCRRPTDGEEADRCRGRRGREGAHILLQGFRSPPPFQPVYHVSLTMYLRVAFKSESKKWRGPVIATSVHWAESQSRTDKAQID